MYENESKACKQVQTKAGEFANSFYNELMNFNLEEQNQILRELQIRTKEERMSKLSELNKEAKYIENSLNDLASNTVM